MKNQIKEQNQFSEFKYINYFEKLQKLALGDDIWPEMAEIDLTDACNHRCLFCIYGSTRVSKNFLKFEDLLNLLPQLRVKGIKSIVFKGGGEPTISPIFSKSLSYAHSLGFEIGLITNGSNLRGENFYTVLNLCKWVRISLDAGSDEIHQVIHNPCKSIKFGFNEIIKSIGELLVERNLRNTDLMIGINFTASKDNYKDIDKTAKLAKELGADYICFRTVMCVGDEMSDRTWEEILKSFELVKKYDEKNFKVITRYQKKGFFEHRDWKSCLSPALIVICQANGDITACCDSRGIPEYVFGNIREMRFEDIWKSMERKNIVRQLPVGKCSQICTDRYGRQNRLIDYLKSDKQHSSFF